MEFQGKRAKLQVSIVYWNFKKVNSYWNFFWKQILFQVPTQGGMDVVFIHTYTHKYFFFFLHFSLYFNLIPRQGGLLLNSALATFLHMLSLLFPDHQPQFWCSSPYPLFAQPLPTPPGVCSDLTLAFLTLLLSEMLPRVNTGSCLCFPIQCLFGNSFHPSEFSTDFITSWDLPWPPHDWYHVCPCQNWYHFGSSQVTGCSFVNKSVFPI